MTYDGNFDAFPTDLSEFDKRKTLQNAVTDWLTE